MMRQLPKWLQRKCMRIEIEKAEKVWTTEASLGSWSLRVRAFLAVKPPRTGKFVGAPRPLLHITSK